MIKYAYQLNENIVMIEKDGGNETRFGVLNGYTSTGVTYTYQNTIFYEALENDSCLTIKETRPSYN